MTRDRLSAYPIELICLAIVQIEHHIVIEICPANDSYYTEWLLYLLECHLSWLLILLCNQARVQAVQ